MSFAITTHDIWAALAPATPDQVVADRQTHARSVGPQTFSSTRWSKPDQVGNDNRTPTTRANREYFHHVSEDVLHHIAQQAAQCRRPLSPDACGSKPVDAEDRRRSMAMLGDLGDTAAKMRTAFFSVQSDAEQQDLMEIHLAMLAGLRNEVDLSVRDAEHVAEHDLHLLALRSSDRLRRRLKAE